LTKWLIGFRYISIFFVQTQSLYCNRFFMYITCLYDWSLFLSLVNNFLILLLTNSLFNDFQVFQYIPCLFPQIVVWKEIVQYDILKFQSFCLINCQDDCMLQQLGDWSFWILLFYQNCLIAPKFNFLLSAPILQEEE